MENVKDSVTELKEAIVGILQEVEWLTYPQLLRVLESRGFRTEGNAQVGDGKQPIMFWGNLSEAVADAISQLTNEKTIKHVSAPLDLYRFEEYEFRLPILQREVEGIDIQTPVVFPAALVYTKEKEKGTGKIQSVPLSSTIVH